MARTEFIHAVIELEIVTEGFPRTRYHSTCWGCIAVSKTQTCPLPSYMPVVEADNKI